ncbi:MAG: type I methionyl aminopeptidase [Anaerolineae bacterium]|nr:type I methionyl aminopeptidase [Anaerolineae bacterium]
MRQAGRIVARVLAELRSMVAPGVTTEELDRAAESLIREMGGTPSFKGYMGYPATICASINEEIVHGIPGKRALQEGDIVSLDVGAIWEGWQADAAITVAVGSIPSQVQRLLEVTQKALEAGIAAARVGQRLGDISHAIEQVAHEAGLEVIREYGGHGIGRAMHEAPRIPNWGRPHQGLWLKAGMTFALEPMLTLGGYETKVLDDHWTVVTADGSLSAHYEHTIVVTRNGGKILTTLDENDEL